MNNLLSHIYSVYTREEGEKKDSGLTPFFSPRCVAVIGASPKADNQGKRIVASMVAQGFPGKIVTVHPQGKAIDPFPVYRHVKDLPESVDLAIAAVAAPSVAPLIEPLAGKGVRHMIVIGGGFAETGTEGEELQQLLLNEARKTGMRIIGPNGMGVFSAAERFNSFFLSPDEIILPQEGPVAIISQSGAFLSQILDQMSNRGVGVNKAVNFGNRVDVGECEILEEFGKDPAIKVIGLYLESMQDGPRFVEIARRVGATKPIIIYKGGHGREGGKAIKAHSASLAGSYEVFQSACDKANLIEVQGLTELINAVQALSQQPTAKGNRILVVSNGGGMGVLLTDLCEKAGLSVPEPSSTSQEHLRETLPEYYSFRNPIDVTGSGTNEQCIQAVEHLLGTGEFDGALIVLLSGTAGITEEIAPLIRSRLPREFPIVIGAYGRTLFPKMKEVFKRDGIPVFPSGEEAARAIEILVRAGKGKKASLREPSIVREWFFFLPRFFSPSRITLLSKKPVIKSAFNFTLYDSQPTRGWLDQLGALPDEMKIKDLLYLCGVRVPSHIHLQSEQDIQTAVQLLGYPLVLKTVSPEVAHKTELKGIRIHLEDEETLLREWEEMNKIYPDKIWAEREMPPGLDLMVGAHRDPEFGPVLLFGTGGRYVEIYQDIQRLLIPATEQEILDLIFSTRAGQIIRGARGAPPLDIKHLSAFLKFVADWMVYEPDLVSLDFNPVRLFEDSLVALDAKAVLGNCEGKG